MNPGRIVLVAAVFALMTFSGPTHVRAHCDGMDGPVVKAAEAALEKGDLNLVLVWVRKDDEREIRDAFEKTLSIRKLGPEAKKWADLFFYETLVRIHRAGEGAPYTGLKPAGRDLGPAIPAADRALETGTEEEVVKLLTEAVKSGIRERFRQVRARKDYIPGDVPAGRDYVQAYVEYVHYVERLYEAAKNPAHGHFPEENAPRHAEHEHDK